MRGLLCIATACFIVLLAASGAAQSSETRDFSPESSDWNGLSDFVRLAEDNGMQVDVSSEVDYTDLESEDVLIFVHPTNSIDVDNAAEYVVDGGRMLVADDFGAAGPMLDRLDVTRLRVEAGDLPHGTYVRGNSALPIFTARGEHPLLNGVERVVANHPTVLTNVGGPVIAYDEGGGIVYDMNLGQGKVIVYGDASMLINHMLAVGENAILAENTVEYLCEGRASCRAKLIVGAFEQSGTYVGEGESESREWADRIDDWNDTLERVMENLPASQLLYYLGILLAAGLSLYLAAVFPVRKSREYSHYIEDSSSDVAKPQAEFDWNLSRFGGGGRETNYALPLAILKEMFEEMFLTRLGRWENDEKDRADVETLGAEYREQYLGDLPYDEAERIENEVVDLLATFARIPTRHRVFLDSDAYFSERDLIKIYRRTRDVLRHMGLEEEYERRTRSLV
ncbi:MAG: DUF4350 domain-containing protein [Myxococcota bacterium]